ncbi:hypothetical protein NVP1244A_165 [Vibrio phage 1.244.A._10N.261.54.C3]|nr:hypothetical protein NVP1244A_165 [Vibrio phage 1.244.A._10N.261.54.C3]AUR98793.1 hypothetical protein NVP1255O_165 [Vibrio phage 1.255.O._10N.286.45.F1]
MKDIEKVLATKPTDEVGNVVYATPQGWATKQKFKPHHEEMIYEFRNLLTILEESGYDKYGNLLETETDGNPDTDDTGLGTDSQGVDGGETGNDGGETDNNSDGSESSDVPEQGTDGTVDEGADGIDVTTEGDTAADNDPEGTGEVDSGSEDEHGTDEDITVPHQTEETDNSSDVEPVDETEYTEEYLMDLPDMKALREVGQKFDVNDVSKAKLVAKILEAQANA